MEIPNELFKDLVESLSNMISWVTYLDSEDCYYLGEDSQPDQDAHKEIEIAQVTLSRAKAFMEK